MHLFKPSVVLAVAALALAVSAGMTTSATAAAPVVVDYGDCAFGSGTASVPAGAPITLTDTGSFTVGVRGLAFHAWKSQQATATIAVQGGATTTEPLVYSQPVFIGDPFSAYVMFLQDVNLDPLAPGESVLVTIDSTATAPEEIVFPGQRGPNHFGPFHIPAGETFETSCLLTAS